MGFLVLAITDALGLWNFVVGCSCGDLVVVFGAGLGQLQTRGGRRMVFILGEVAKTEILEWSHRFELIAYWCN